MNMAARNHCSRPIARGLHGHNGCPETSPEALSRLNFQVEDSEKFGLAVETTGPKTKKAGATWRGFLPDTDPIYRSGWNFLAGANLNPVLPPPSDEGASEPSDRR